MLEHFYHGIIRKVIVAFGVLFDEIYITKLNSDSQELERIKVPLAYGPKQKFISRIDASDPNLVHNIEMKTPRMGFEMTSINYDQSRKTMSTTRLYSQANRNPETGLRSSFIQVPYNLNITLHIVSKNTEDMLQILEQILPYFTPDFTVRIDQISLNRTIDVPITLLDVSFIETYEGDFEERKAFVCSINFLVRTQMIGPATEAKIIKEADISFYDRYSLDNFLSGLTNYNLLETLTISVTGGATAGSFGPTGTYEIGITGPYS